MPIDEQERKRREEEYKKFGRLPVAAYDLYINGIQKIAEKRGISIEQAAAESISEAEERHAHEHIDFIKAALKFLQQQRDGDKKKK
ncbi:MAG: hypothetical protein A2383_00895 [Candidatus Pacebacteria bacterium RIFOXYB1_FULL_39_46]|nr:MAG: hypothetical protein A2182_00730 [Candidatus Pacebacteria bacterium RIFOXYA1_FULL_38_18]OGJ38139.1 MAG: hypothetical protein A2383_00895 [Candidatus Pacebacteria bacterium RIFOXYB1_FULL_39_46]OGJ39639.1 MAG: hypothetical protein A2411_02545 [Candidatus Pacebacteria bacterium RIFOXYC1_FULL_39_21]OGJ39891.1 MAG: hypothetical protein A2582_00660 [Candidatus Pacebacteria bacterium RIFOXYD1_FULL_39_27]